MEVDMNGDFDRLEVLGSRAPTLPPCKICQNPSTGFHYGANTCEACKAFFRRTLKKKEVNFMCICEGHYKPGQPLDGSQKSLCPSCRYKRCIEAGMSKDAVKVGRYSHSWKIKNIEEVKKIEEQEKVQEKNDASFSSMSSPSSTSSAVPSPPSITTDHAPSGEHPQIKIIMPRLGICTCELACPVHSMFAFSDQSDLLDFSEQYDSVDIESIIARLKAEQERQDLENIKQLPVNCCEEQKAYLEQKEARRQLFGDIGELSYEEFITFYQQTGIALDNRLTVLADHVTMMEQKMHELIAFAQNIEGFDRLPVEDKANLVKYSRCESTIIGCLFIADEKHQVITCPRGSVVHLAELMKLLDKEFVEGKFILIGKINKMQLTLEERSILRGIMVTYSDRCNLQQRSEVAEIQNHLIRALQKFVSRSYSNPGDRLVQLFALLVSLRNYSDWERKILRQIAIDYPIVQNYAIIREIVM